MSKVNFTYVSFLEIIDDLKNESSELGFGCNEVLDSLCFYFFNLSKSDKLNLIMNFKGSKFYENLG